ncbi:MAG: glycosyltransferase [Cyanobacteria bacterium P01_A01_bin.84]
MIAVNATNTNTNNVRRPRVLVSAYACRPDMGSEPGVGWNVVQQLVKYCDVWVLTRQDNRPAIEAELENNPLPGVCFIYCDLPAWAKWWNYKAKAVQIHYYIWQIIAYFVARKLHQQINFDLAHHVTYVKYWSPSFISFLPIPFIWGPVGGGESAPKPFWKDFSFRGKFYEILRDGARWLGEHDPFVGMTARKSIIVRVTTEDTARRLYKMGVSNVEIFSETGLSQEEIASLGEYPSPTDLPIRFISMGRLLHWKGFHLGLQAFAQAKLSNSEYWILGDGPERKRLELLVEELGIVGQVKFWNRLPRTQTLEKLSQCIALVHPSLHDSGGWVCLEAMAVGRPVLCLDLGGPGTQVTSETGCKVAAHTPEQAVRDLSQAMVRLALEPNLQEKMGLAGQKRVKDLYSWEVKGKSLAQLYSSITSQRLTVISEELTVNK